MNEEKIEENKVMVSDLSKTIEVLKKMRQGIQQENILLKHRLSLGMVFLHKTKGICRVESFKGLRLQCSKRILNNNFSVGLFHLNVNQIKSTNIYCAPKPC